MRLREVGQLKRDGSIGKPTTFGFVGAQTIIDRLKADGTDMRLTVGLSYRNPVTDKKLFDNVEAIRWLMKAKDFYTYEAYYVTDDDELHVTALTDNDLF